MRDRCVDRCQVEKTLRPRTRIGTSLHPLPLSTVNSPFLCAQPGYMVEAPHIAQLLKDTQEDLLQNKENRPDGDGTGTFAPEPLSGIASYFIGSSPRLAKERVEMEHRFQKRYGTGHTSHECVFSFSAGFPVSSSGADQPLNISQRSMAFRGCLGSQGHPRQSSRDRQMPCPHLEGF
jgi:hypothetical protein